MERQQIPIILALIKNGDGQILIARRNDESLVGGHNKWELVGGKLEWDETPEQAVVREAREETGLEVEVIRMLPKTFVNYWKKSDGEYKVILLPFECRIVGGQLRTENHDHRISELKFIDKADIAQYDWIGQADKIVAADY